jgi:hypothetical protein
MQKEQKLIQEEAQAAVLEAAAAAPAVMAGAHVGHADGAAAAAGKERVLEVRPHGTMQCVAAACFQVRGPLGYHHNCLVPFAAPSSFVATSTLCIHNMCLNTLCFLAAAG